MINWLAQKFEDFKFFIYEVMLTVFVLLKDFVSLVYDGFLAMALLIIDGLGALFDGLDIASYFTALPPSVHYFASASGLSEALGMIVTASTIRFFLQLIPFTRLGS